MFTTNWVAQPDDVRRNFDSIVNALVEETTEQPQEIWTSFEKHETTGQVRAIEHRLRNAGSIGSWDVAFLVVKMVQTSGRFEFEDFWLETTVENLDRDVRFGIRTKPDYFHRDRPY